MPDSFTCMEVGTMLESVLIIVADLNTITLGCSMAINASAIIIILLLLLIGLTVACPAKRNRTPVAAGLIE